MANCYYHALSSVKKWGGVPEDYQPIHDWFDDSKKHIATVAHRALRHHTEGCFMCEQVFGTTITNSDGRKVPVRLIAERHITEDCGYIPKVSDWLSAIRIESWMQKGYLK